LVIVNATQLMESFQQPIDRIKRTDLFGGHCVNEIIIIPTVDRNLCTNMTTINIKWFSLPRSLKSIQIDMGLNVSMTKFTWSDTWHYNRISNVNTKCWFGASGLGADIQPSVSNEEINHSPDVIIESLVGLWCYSSISNV